MYHKYKIGGNISFGYEDGADLCDWGMWMHWNDFSTFDFFDTVVGKKMSWCGCGAWMFPSYYEDSPSYAYQVSGFIDQVNIAYNRAAIPVVMWSPAPVRAADYVTPIPDSDYYNQRFIDGVFDDYFVTLAQALAADGREVHFRMFHEMNGNTWPGAGWGSCWSARYWTDDTKTVAINTPTTFRNAWIHIVNIFRFNGATNVKFWFSVGDVPGVDFGGLNDPLAPIYPGDGYVDILGIEIYNGKADPPFDGATSSNVSMEYNEVAALSETTRMVLAEVGCFSTTIPSDKASWLSDVLNPMYIQCMYPRISGLMYWDDIETALGWSLRETSASETAAVNAFKSPKYAGVDV